MSAAVRVRSAVCPDCGQRLTDGHTRDTGEATTPPEGACPVLFERRNRQLPIDFPDRRRSTS